MKTTIAIYLTNSDRPLFFDVEEIKICADYISFTTTKDGKGSFFFQNIAGYEIRKN